MNALSDSYLRKQAHLSGQPSELRGHIQFTSLRLTLEKTNLWLLLQMTVGRSEQANTLVVERERNVLNTVGWVPKVTFLRSLSKPAEKYRMRREENRTLSLVKAQNHIARLRTRCHSPFLKEASLKCFFSPVSMLSPKQKRAPSPRAQRRQWLLSKVVIRIDRGMISVGKRDFEFLFRILAGILTQDTSTYLLLASPCAVVQRMGALRYGLRCLSRGQWHKVGTAHCCPLMG